MAPTMGSAPGLSATVGVRPRDPGSERQAGSTAICGRPHGERPQWCVANDFALWFRRSLYLLTAAIAVFRPGSARFNIFATHLEPAHRPRVVHEVRRGLGAELPEMTNG